VFTVRHAIKQISLSRILTSCYRKERFYWSIWKFGCIPIWK